MNELITKNLNSAFRAIKNGDPLRVESEIVSAHPDYKKIPKRNYAPMAVTETGSWGNPGMTRTASAAGTIYGQPQFFSPVHTPINWQIPSKRLEEAQWARFFYMNEPKIAASIDFYSYFPMSDWEHECKVNKVKRYFDLFKKKHKLPHWMRLISQEIHLIGDCFPLIEISCPQIGRAHV
jgi:hypothetical protein